MASQTPPKTPDPALRMAIDFGPLIVFFAVNFLVGGEQISRVVAATVAFMTATAIAMALSQWKTGHISPMLWLSGVLVLVFGGLTIYFHDETFIKIKPTIIYLMFASVLIFGLVTGRPLLQYVLESAYPGLSPKGWRQLTINWAAFFAFQAALNEAVWRNTSWDFWVAYKLWGVIPMTLIFAVANLPMLMKNGMQVSGDTPPPIPPEG